MKYVEIPSVEAIITHGALKREGMIADVLFPKVKVSASPVGYLDWDKAKELTGTDDTLTCTGDVKQIDTEGMEVKYLDIKPKGNSVSISECNINICGQENLEEVIEQAKMVTLMDNLLINKEKRAIALATDESKYTDNTTKVPGEAGAVNEGGVYHITPTNFNDKTFDLLKWLQPIQENNYMTGKRNIAVMTRNVFNTLLRNQSFIGSGCAVPATTTESVIASLLGVEKIVIADAGFNNAVTPGTVNMQGFWPEKYILFASVKTLTFSQAATPTFGATPYKNGFQTIFWIDPKKGEGKGAVYGKTTHDETEQVVTYKAATLVEITA